MPKLVESKGRNKRKKIERKLRSIRDACSNDLDKCGHFIPEESKSCLSLCMSEECHNVHFAGNPLEDGEVDFARWVSFEKCVKDELRRSKKK